MDESPAQAGLLLEGVFCRKSRSLRRSNAHLTRAAGFRPILRKEDAQAALEDALRDEPGWAGTLSVEPVELDEGDVSAN
jgi:hypothetical protein